MTDGITAAIVSTGRLPLVPDLDEARRFLALLDPDADGFVLQCFDDSPEKRRELARTMGGPLDTFADNLVRLQEQGAGIFLTVNRSATNRRKAADIDMVRALFVDLDGAPLEPVLANPLAPLVIVESSPGKYHCYWIVEDVPLDQFKPWQRRLAAIYGGDKSVNDLPRVMRLPGFWHLKGKPFRTRIIQTVERWPYVLGDFVEAFGELPAAEENGNGHDAGEAQTMADLVRDVLSAENYHDPLRNLAWRYLAGGMDPADAVRTLQGIMDSADGPRDDRWQARYADVPRAVESAKDKLRGLGAGELTDDGLALEMGKAWEPDGRFCNEWGKWIFWHGDRWEVDRTKLHLTRTRAWLRAKAASIVEARPSMARKAAVLRDDKMIYALDRLVTSNAELVTTTDAWDRDPMLLGGPMTVDLRTGEARDPQPGDFMLKRVACAPAPPGAATPLWARFLAEITDGDAALQDYMRRMTGYMLTGSVSEHAFWFGYGTGANGKSTFVNVVRSILGDYATTIGSEVLMWSSYDRHPTEIAKLRGVRLAVASEIERGKAWAESKIKSLTGGDAIQARFMRQDFFEFAPQFKLVVIGNHKPGLRAVDEAIRRRMHMIPFVVTIPPGKRDKHLEDKLKGEAPAILRWMLDGCLAWQERGLDPPKIVKAATADYLASEDSFALWRETCTKPDPAAWEPAGDLWNSWRQWAGDAGEVAGSQKAFANLLTEHGFVPHRKVEGRGYCGAKLLLNTLRERAPDPAP